MHCNEILLSSNCIFRIDDSKNYASSDTSTGGARVLKVKCEEIAESVKLESRWFSIFGLQMENKTFKNLSWGHVMFHTKFGPDRISRFDVYWTLTNKQSNKQTDKQSINAVLEGTLFIYIQLYRTLYKYIYNNSGHLEHINSKTGHPV